MAKGKPTSKLIIAGPGAGKTHNMVGTIIDAIGNLEPCRYMAVITYTNSATNNIKKRLEPLIRIPENFFIGTMHSFLNRFVVIPYASIGNSNVGKEKLFMQCGLEDVFSNIEKQKPKEKRITDVKAIAKRKSDIKQRLNLRGYITFDQTLSIAKECIERKAVASILSNRLQYLFIDEFQDSDNDVFSILENIRKQGRTIIYCVGDPEQYIQGFDSSIKSFVNIPILKASQNSSYTVEINRSNFRSTRRIVDFLNNFNGRDFGKEKFSQVARSRSANPNAVADLGEPVHFVIGWESVSPMIASFNKMCDNIGIPIAERCIIAKKNDLVNRIKAALDNRYMDPKKSSGSSPIKTIQDTLLTTLQMGQMEFFTRYNTDVYTLRSHCIAILKAIKNGVITNENTYGIFITDSLGLEMKKGLPVKIANLKFDYSTPRNDGVITVSNIHTIKGLESHAVLAIAKDEQELLLWLETDQLKREAKRDRELKDHPRLGYVAFSRAEKLLCIGCLQPISIQTREHLEGLGVIIEKVS
ncbi:MULTISPECIES: UvrD-helicase domain-containing protein [unclassified Pedobacter]|uniref:UvrD-helicase domain-containing protein n=1 Tax=unclassified Pedobacter TaxID=2628915 RepID=UPI00181C838A|nr:MULTISPECIES: UvrD-helicase domain-containing protein [unclassified Pedobacter]NII83485.1 DNA helicase-2/ATP-dependent DNA helicase PcrA [Pedobacter sp. SG908]NMN37349.1 DNA helicase-2/ATP-dependent DNA helicase PcrA [Pedobacter sp. SG918]